MKIIAIILLSSLTIFNCASYNEVRESKFEPSVTKGCVAQTTTNDRLKCIANWLKTSQNKENSKIDFEEVEGERIDWKNINTKYVYCNVDVKTEQVYSCIEHKTLKYKPTLGYYIWDYGKIVLIAGASFALGGL